MRVVMKFKAVGVKTSTAFFAILKNKRCFCILVIEVNKYGLSSRNNMENC